jgi:hypothetical protein
MGWRLQSLEVPHKWADRVTPDTSVPCPNSQQAQAQRLSAVLRCIPGKIDHKRLQWVLTQFKGLEVDTLRDVFFGALTDLRIKWTASAEDAVKFLCWGRQIGGGSGAPAAAV